MEEWQAILEGENLIVLRLSIVYFFFSSRRRHTRCSRDWSSDVCSSDLFSSRHETEREFGHLPLAPERARTPFSRAVHSGEKPVGAFCERRGVVALIIKSRLGVVVNVCSRVIFPASVILKMRCYNRAGHRPFSGRQSGS